MHGAFKRVSLRTAADVEVQDVTGAVRAAVRDAGVENGIACVSVPHTTCAVCVNENEAGLRSDLERLAREVLAPLAAAGSFAHDRVDDNARAHLTAVLLGNSVTVAVANGAPVLGTWQSIFLVELDGPRSRELHVQVLGT
jgi:secondary thiamine-phosphate synthase enzyme